MIQLPAFVERGDPADATAVYLGEPLRPLGIRKPLVLCRVDAVRPLHRPGSTKPTFLVDASPERGALDWEPGDSLAVFPQNDPDEVEATLSGFGSREVASGAPPRETAELRAFLAWQADLRSVDPSATATEDRMPVERAAEVDGSVEEAFRRRFRRQKPRLYTIGGEVESGERGGAQLVVARVDAVGGQRFTTGVTSGWFADRVRPGDRFWGFVQPNRRFRFEPSAATPQIFVGAGTGVAPFRAELQRRGRAGVVGPTWLFFGARRSDQDHWFEQETRAWLAEGTLRRYDVAFSRDVVGDRYVQDALRRRGEDVLTWLDGGAVVSVCGASRLREEISRALAEIVDARSRRAIGSGPQVTRTGDEYVAALRDSGRLRFDVY